MMGKYKPYEKYKNSGIAWLGEVPEHWQIKRAKWIFSEISVKDFPNEPLLAATQTKGVVLKSKYENRTVVAQNNLETLKLVEPGDFVISLRSFQGGIELAHDRGIISSAYTVLRLKDQNQDGYFKYLLKSKDYINSLTLLVTGIREGQNIDTNKFKESLLFTPTASEQTAIARFLDYKLSKINRFIRKKKQLIKLLNEQKAAIINQAVTKGLNPNADMKNNGIEWLGEIPAHWEVRKLKGLTSIISKGTTPNTVNKEILLEGAIIFLKAENISLTNEMSYYPRHYIDEGTNDLLKRSQLEEDDILFVIAGATIGKTTILPIDYTPSNTNQAVAFIRLKDKSNVKFIWYWLQGNFIKQNIWLEAVTSAQPNLAMGRLGNFTVIFPPPLEQQQIVAHIEAETALLTTAISTIANELTLVEEYKTALIAEAVTGKIDVRGYAVPETDMEADSYEEIEEVLSMAAEDAAEYQTEETE